MLTYKMGHRRLCLTHFPFEKGKVWITETLNVAMKWKNTPKQNTTLQKSVCFRMQPKTFHPFFKTHKKNIKEVTLDQQMGPKKKLSIQIIKM